MAAGLGGVEKRDVISDELQVTSCRLDPALDFGRLVIKQQTRGTCGGAEADGALAAKLSAGQEKLIIYFFPLRDFFKIN